MCSSHSAGIVFHFIESRCLEQHFHALLARKFRLPLSMTRLLLLIEGSGRLWRELISGVQFSVEEAREHATDEAIEMLGRHAQLSQTVLAKATSIKQIYPAEITTANQTFAEYEYTCDQVACASLHRRLQIYQYLHMLLLLVDQLHIPFVHKILQLNLARDHAFGLQYSFR